MSTRLGWASFFIALFIFKENGNHKNNMLDINVSKVNYRYIYCICASQYCMFVFEVALTFLKQYKFMCHEEV